jgi:hypothetical protein
MLSKRKELHRLGRCVESILLVATEDCRGLCDGGTPLDACTSISEYLAGLRVVTSNTAVYLVTGTPVTSGSVAQKKFCSFRIRGISLQPSTAIP